MKHLENSNKTTTTTTYYLLTNNTKQNPGEAKPTKEATENKTPATVAKHKQQAYSIPSNKNSRQNPIKIEEENQNSTEMEAPFSISSKPSIMPSSSVSEIHPTSMSIYFLILSLSPR